MNIVQWLVFPWMAMSRPIRRFFAPALLVLAVVGGITLALHGTPASTGHVRLLHFLAIFVGILWTFVPPRALILANQARRLGMPGIGRAAVRSTLAYAAITVLLPAVVLAMLGGHAATALTELALAAGIGMAYATFPIWIGMWAGFAFVLDNEIAKWLPVPSTDPARFVQWAAPLTLVLWALLIVIWRRTARGLDDTSGWRRSAVAGWGKFASRDRNATSVQTVMLSRRSAWLEPRADLKHTGPRAVVPSLRIALGGWSMPQTWSSRWRQVGLAAAVILAITLVFVLVASFDDHPRTSIVTVASGIVVGTACMLGLFSSMLGVGAADALLARWHRDNGAVALLALLPGLGGSRTAKRDLLRAALVPTLRVQGVLFAGMLLVGVGIHLPPTGYALLLLAQLGSMLLGASMGITTLGGTSLHGIWRSVFSLGAIVVIVGTQLLALPLSSDTTLLQQPDTLLPFAAIWAALLAMLLAIGRRGWRAYWQQPHPFLTQG